MYSLILLSIFLNSISELEAINETEKKFNYVITFHRIFPRFNLVCTGSAITKRLAISAAHCFHNETIENIKITSNRVYNPPFKFGSMHSIEKLIRNKNNKFNTRSGKHDIILVQVDRDLPNLARIPENHFSLRKGLNCETIGWQFDKMKYIQTNITERKTEDLKKIKTRVRSTDWARRGDSGGPLVCPKDSDDFLVGILSTGELSGENEYESVFRHLLWIRSVMQENQIERNQNKSASNSPKIWLICNLILNKWLL